MWFKIMDTACATNVLYIQRYFEDLVVSGKDSFVPVVLTLVTRGGIGWPGGCQMTRINYSD